jgi:RNA polymerase primary sigma factor
MSNEELVKQIQQGNPGVNMELLYIQNDGLIRKIAKKYSFIDDMDDLIQEAYFGLYEAVKRYEDTAGVLFMTYAAFWIKQAIKRYLENNGRSIRIPSGLQANVYKYKRVVKAFEMQLGRKPSDNELCKHLGISSNGLEALKKAVHQYGEIKSLDEPLPGNDDESILLGDGVSDQNINIENDTINRIMENSLHSELWQIVKDNVTPEQNTVINARFRKNMTLEQTGQLIGKSKDMARNLEAQALRKLRLRRITRQLEDKFEANYSRAYRSGFNGWQSHEWTSIVESIALKTLELEESKAVKQGSKSQVIG